MLKKIVLLLILIFSYCKSNAASLQIPFEMEFDGNLEAVSEKDTHAKSSSILSFKKGKSGQAAVVGDKCYISIPRGNKFNAVRGEISMWVKPLDWNGNDKKFHFFLHCRNNQTNSILLLEKAPNSILYFLLGNKKKYSRAFTDIKNWQAGQWHQLKVGWSPEKIMLYVDGKLVSSAIRNGETEELGKNFEIGGRVYSPCEGSQAIDLLKINKSPTSAEPDSKDLKVLFHKTFDGSNCKLIARGKVGFTKGVKGQAAVVSGSDYICHDFSINANSGTAMFWIKPINVNDQEGNVGLLWTKGKNDWFICQYLGKRNAIYFYTGNRKKYDTVIGQCNLNPDKWLHVILTWNEKCLKMYIDGQKAGKTVKRHVIPEELGKYLYSGGGLYGKKYGEIAIDNLIIYDRFLNDAEIRAEYKLELSKLQKQGNPAVKLQIQNAAQKQSAMKMAPRNIATSESKAIMLSSSQWKHDRSLSVEQAADGNFKTYYISGKSKRDKWIELRWPQPVIVDGVQVTGRAPHAPKTYIVKIPTGKGWKEISKVSSKNMDSLIKFKPVSSDKIRVYFPYESIPQIAISQLQVTGEAPKTFLKEPSWPGFFIWYPEPSKNDVVRYFRRNFDIKTKTKITKAILQMCCDDAFTVYINGKRVGTGGFIPELYDVTRLLRSGQNCIAVEAQEFSICEGVLGELTLVDKKGNVRRIGTDTQWLAAAKVEKGWQSFDYNDKTWKRAIRSLNLGEYAKNIKYRYLGAGDIALKLERMVIKPTVVRPGSLVKLNATFMSKSKISQDYGFRVILGEKALSHSSEYTVAVADANPQIPTSQWKPNKVYTVEWSLKIPSWAPHGTMPLRIKALNANSEAVIKASQQTVDIVRFENLSPRRNKTVKSAIVSRGGQLRVEVDGKIMPPVFFCLNSYNNTFRELGEHSSIKTGIYRYLLLGCDLYPPVGADKEKFFKEKMAIIDQDIKNALRLFPNAYFLFGLSFRPGAEWSKNWPDETVHMADGSKIKHSFSSEVWLKMSQDAAQRIVKHLRSSNYAGHIAGIHFSIGEGAEAMHWGHRINEFETPRKDVITGDFSPAATKKFRVYLRKLYSNNEKEFRNAWKDDKVTFENATVNINELRKAGQQNFRDPAKGRMFMDYWNFHSDSIAEGAIRIADKIKEASNDEWIVGLWGFYNLAQLHLIYEPSSSHFVGYCGIDKVLRSNSIDYLACIQSYAGVNAGTPVITGMPDASFKLHNKMFLEEFDIRTFFTDLTFSHSHTTSQWETQNIIKRDFGKNIVCNNLSWFCGFARGTEGRRSIGWYSEESIIKLLNQCVDIGKAVQAYPNKSIADVALFVNSRDITTMDIMDAPGTLINTQYNTVYKELRKIAVSYDCYFVDDFSEKLIKPYKVIIMLDAFFLTEGKRNMIRKALEAQGKTVIWLYAPGFSDPKHGLSLENIKELTGMNVKMTPEFREKLDVEISGKNAYTSGLTGRKFGPCRYAHDRRTQQIGPIFNIDDPSVNKIASYLHNGKTAIAEKKVGGMTSIYSALPIISRELLINIFKQSGVHFYLDKPVYMNASNRFLAMHSFENINSGTIQMRKTAWVLDLFENKIVNRGKRYFNIKLPFGTSKFYFIGKENEVKNLQAKLKK